MASHPSPPAAPRRLLVVDDVPDLLKVLVFQLARIGFTATVCSTVEEALDALAGESYSGALIDLYFGLQPAGLELVTAIRRDPRTADLPVVSMSGSSRAELQRCLDHGADAVLPKPFELDQFTAAMDRAVAARRRPAA